jgi:hypothetical protein
MTSFTIEISNRMISPDFKSYTMKATKYHLVLCNKARACLSINLISLNPSRITIPLKAEKIKTFEAKLVCTTSIE